MASIYDELGGIAADPRTDWNTLHWIAEKHPELRPTVAENPGTYPELLEALAALGDPEIDAALARRISTPAPPSAGAAGAAAEPADPAEPPDPAEPQASDASDASDAAQDSEDYGGEEWFGTGSYAAGSYAAGSSAPSAQGPFPRRRLRAPALVLAVLLPVLALVAVTALALSLLQGSFSNDATTAEAPGSAQPGEEGASPAEEPAPSPTPEPPTLEELRTEVAALPTESSCESPDEDREVLADLASAGTEGGRWVDSADGSLVAETLVGLQESCSNTHAAALYLDLRESEQTAAALRTTVQEMGPGWIQTSFPAQGQQLSSFVSPDGNVVCELSATARCRVLWHSFNAPEGCVEGVTYAIRVDRPAEPDCENPVPQEGQPILGYGQTASNEFFACSSFRSQMSCWNQLTGEGINLSASRNSTY